MIYDVGADSPVLLEIKEDEHICALSRCCQKFVNYNTTAADRISYPSTWSCSNCGDVVRFHSNDFPTSFVDWSSMHTYNEVWMASLIERWTGQQNVSVIVGIR